MLAELVVAAKVAEKKYSRFFSVTKEKVVSVVLSTIGIISVIGGIVLPVLLG